MTTVSSVIIAILLLFAGCTKIGEEVMAPASTDGIASRDFLLGGALPEEGYGAYGYLLFTKRPDVSSRNRTVPQAS